MIITNEVGLKNKINSAIFSFSNDFTDLVELVSQKSSWKYIQSQTNWNHNSKMVKYEFKISIWVRSLIRPWFKLSKRIWIFHFQGFKFLLESKSLTQNYNRNPKKLQSWIKSVISRLLKNQENHTTVLNWLSSKFCNSTLGQ